MLLAKRILLENYIRKTDLLCQKALEDFLGSPAILECRYSIL